MTLTPSVKQPQMLASPFLGLSRNNAKETWKNDTGQLLLRRLRLLSVHDSFCEGMGTIVRSPMPYIEMAHTIIILSLKEVEIRAEASLGLLDTNLPEKKIVSFTFSESLYLME